MSDTVGSILIFGKISEALCENGVAVFVVEKFTSETGLLNRIVLSIALIISCSIYYEKNLRSEDLRHIRSIRLRGVYVREH